MNKLILILTIILSLAVDIKADDGLSFPFSEPADPLSVESLPTIDNKEDEKKSAEELIQEAIFLLGDERPLDARTKLLTVLSKDPTQYKAHILLAGYYLVHVGHFRLALRYIKQAEKIFLEKKGPPPYSDPMDMNEHARILYLLSESKLNLDDYQGSLSTLDYFSSLGYFAEWYPGTRAWVLMKLGRLDEATRVARMGILTGAEPGRTLNILGILLSMTRDRQNSIRIFDEAIMYELSMGNMGQPATPMNNQGEVYRETFLDEKAEASWLKATRLPDGCEHVLPSMNLAMLYTENLQQNQAKQAMDHFEECIRQYPLRNGEEHAAIVHLARGRIDYHTGHINEAIEHFESALNRRQWFGKIGTSSDDLRVAAMISLAQALRAQVYIDSFKLNQNLLGWANQRIVALQNRIRAWWILRRAREILVEDLNNLEDIFIRHTDSMIEYPTLGDLLEGFSAASLSKLIEKTLEIDDRPEAKSYYDGYLGQDLLGTFQSSKGANLTGHALDTLRPDYDRGLKLQLLLIRADKLSENSDGYRALSKAIYKLEPAALRNHGLKLPVIIKSENSKILSEIKKSAFVATNEGTPYIVEGTTDAQGYILKFTTIDGSRPVLTERDIDLSVAVDNLTQAIFSENLK